MKKIVSVATCALLLWSCNQEAANNIKDVDTAWNTSITEVVDTPNLETNTDAQMAKKDTLQNAPLKDGDLVATIKTTNGTIKVKLFQNEVPSTVNNFAILAQDKYYDGIIFHRIISGFILVCEEKVFTEINSAMNSIQNSQILNTLCQWQMHDQIQMEANSLLIKQIITS